MDEKPDFYDELIATVETKLRQIIQEYPVDMEHMGRLAKEGDARANALLGALEHVHIARSHLNRVQH